MARGSKAKAIERLQKVRGEVAELKVLRRHSAEFKKWRRNTRVAIAHSFGSESSHVKDFNDIYYSLRAFTTATSDSEFQAAYVRGLEVATSILESMIDEIKEYWKEDEQSSNSSGTAIGERAKDAREIFVIHGHDEAARETIARFLEQLGLKPVILHEQANKGRTIIEKFEDHADVAFAVVLLTPDDAGGLRDEKSRFKPRARQNVIFELGFFLGKLGRQRVCPLVKGDVETPSDYDGVVYTDLDDAGGWKVKLVRELKAAGVVVDANRVFQA